MNIERIRELLAYSPSDGAFYWLKNRKGNPAPRAGDVAGGTRPDGCRYIGIDGRRYYAHRVAWLLVYGPIPGGMEIDHIDHNPSNNRISNLRLVTKSANRHTKNLGYFKNIDEAIAARKAAEVALGFHVNHGAQK